MPKILFIALLLFTCIAALFLCLSGCAQVQGQEKEPIYVTVNGKVFEAEDLGDGIIATPEPLKIARIFSLTGDVAPMDLGDCREYAVRATENNDVDGFYENNRKYFLSCKL